MVPVITAKYKFRTDIFAQNSGFKLLKIVQEPYLSPTQVLPTISHLATADLTQKLFETLHLFGLFPTATLLGDHLSALE